jgi:endonuclease III
MRKYLEKSKMKNLSKNIEIVMKTLSKEFPVSKTTLNRMKTEEKPNAFRILISCLLSLRTQDKNTEIASKRLFEVADTPEEILSLSQEKLENLIYSSGHYKKKARTLKHVSEIIIKDFNNKVPEKREELMSIKGIGPKTANIVLAFAFGKDVLPIDTHCHRIPNRLGWIKTKTPEKTEEELNKILPKKYWREFNSIFVQFGKTICQPISPLCSTCPINNYCQKVGVVRNR